MAAGNYLSPDDASHPELINYFMAVVEDCPTSDADSTCMGDICQPGYTCAASSSSMASCPAGLYCPDYRMAASDSVANPCRAGFYCSGGARSPTPGNVQHDSSQLSDPNQTGFTGTYCSEGSYCGA